MNPLNLIADGDKPVNMIYTPCTKPFPIYLYNFDWLK